MNDFVDTNVLSEATRVGPEAPVVRRLTSSLLPAFAGWMVPLEEQEMNLCADLQAAAERTGRRIPVIASLVAAMARCRGLTIATRNVEDFRHCDVPVVNPWSEAA